MKKTNSRSSNKKSQSVRCHECKKFDHYRNKCPNYKKNLTKGKGKAMAVSLTNGETNFRDQSDSSSSEN